MVHAYILKNQHDLFLDKHGQWVDQADAAQLYRTLHKDEAINSMVEYSVKNPDLRIKVEACAVNAKGNLVLAGADLDLDAPAEADAASTETAEVPAETTDASIEAADAPVETIDAPTEAIDQSEPHLFAPADQSAVDPDQEATSGA